MLCTCEIHCGWVLAVYLPTVKLIIAYQSSMAVKPVSTWPRRLEGRKPPDTKEFTLTPPSQLESLPPFKGQLLAATANGTTDRNRN